MRWWKTAEGDLTTCGGCTAKMNCLHNQCDCFNAVPIPVYCNPACGCKCGKKCRNQCMWLEDRSNRDFTCALFSCADKRKPAGLFQCNDGDIHNQVFGQPSTSCGRYFHRTCVNILAPAKLCPACSHRLVNIDAGNELVGLRKDAAEALIGARKSEIAANSAADKESSCTSKIH
jgi:hypothetical protein